MTIERIVQLETLLRRMLCSNEMSNGWKSQIQMVLADEHGAVEADLIARMITASKNDALIEAGDEVCQKLCGQGGLQQGDIFVQWSKRSPARTGLNSPFQTLQTARRHHAANISSGGLN